MSSHLTIQQALTRARQTLSSTSDSAPLDAEVLLMHLLDKPRSHLHAWPEKVLSVQQIQDYEALITRRAQGEPIAYITGQREFWSLNLSVNPDTLIPRPATETLIEWALQHFPTSSLKVADLGTGSGAIALALAHERPQWQLIASDQSPKALIIAKQNARQLKLNNIQFIESNWLQSIEDNDFDLIISNPPYIRADDIHLQQGDIRFEPITALRSGISGLDDIRIIIEQSVSQLKSAGWLALEHGYDQAIDVTNLLKSHKYQSISTIDDLAGQPRLTIAQIT